MLYTAFYIERKQMKLSKIKIFGSLISAIAKKAEKRKFVSAIILAAGSSSRMNSDTTKQWLEIYGTPTVARSVIAFDNCPLIDEIIICVKEDEIPLYKDFKTRFAVSKPLLVIKGGNSRQSSALEGFKRISDSSDFVAIHDAARCLITPEMISDVIRAAYKDGASCACCTSPDTVKISDENGYILSTPERKSIRLAQTPQVFKTEIYRVSAYKALSDGLAVTDDASMAEHAGFAVKLVDCGRENLKITEPSDVTIAEAILRKRDII